MDNEDKKKTGQKCAFDQNRECDSSCVAWRPYGLYGKFKYNEDRAEFDHCERGKFDIK